MKQKLSEIAQINIHLRNEKTKYNNQKTRAKKYEELYKESKQSNLEKDELIKKLKQDKPAINGIILVLLCSTRISDFSP